MGFKNPQAVADKKKNCRKRLIQIYLDLKNIKNYRVKYLSTIENFFLDELKGKELEDFILELKSNEDLKMNLKFMRELLILPKHKRQESSRT